MKRTVITTTKKSETIGEKIKELAINYNSNFDSATQEMEIFLKRKMNESEVKSFERRLNSEVKKIN